MHILKWATAQVAVVGLGMVIAGSAFAHANVVTGTAACEANGTFTINWTVANDYNLSELVSLVPGPHQGKIEPALPGTVGPLGSVFVTQAGLPNSNLPMITSQTLTVNGAWSDGYSRNNSGTTQFQNGGCFPTIPPKVHHHKKKHRRFRAVTLPIAHIQGPCGDPFYRVSFDNTNSNVPLDFTWTFTSYRTGTRVQVRRRLLAGTVFESRYFHVLGFTKMNVRSHGKFIATGTAAAPGEYGTCPA